MKAGMLRTKHEDLLVLQMFFGQVGKVVSLGLAEGRYGLSRHGGLNCRCSKSDSRYQFRVRNVKADGNSCNE